MHATLPYFTTVFFANAPEPEPRQIVCVLAKRTYELDRAGRLRRAAQQEPLALDGTYTEVTAERPCSVPLSEPDLWPSKPATDVVLLGKAYAPGGRPTRSFTTSLAIGPHRRELRVMGDRRVSRLNGRLVFSQPEPLTELELGWERAYGGIDDSVPMPEIGDLIDLLDAMDTERHPGAYPRNPAGRGYTIAGDGLDSLLLPNFEDPADLLTPERLLVKSPQQWWRMPLPAGYGWFSPSWYPRCMFAGILPRHAPPDQGDELPERRMGLVPPGQYRRLQGLEVQERMDWRLTSGAAPGLAVPYLRGDEAVQLVNLDPGGELRFALPGERPRVEVRFEGDVLPVATYLHTVLIEPEQRRVSLVWGTRGYTPRLLPEGQPDLDSPKLDPLAGFEIFIDGAEYPHGEEDYMQP